jgi:hypothetical protein
MVTKVENQAQIGGAAASVGSILHMNDRLTTGPKSRLEVTFRDKTTLTLGENANVVIDKFAYNPEQSTGELLLNSSKGALRMATGGLGAMRDSQINVSTPSAIMGVRGTDWWWGPMQGRLGVLLVSNSKVSVAKPGRGQAGCPRHKDEPSCLADTANFCSWNRDRSRCESCEVELREANEGTFVERGGCPEAPSTWSPAQVQAALSQTQLGFAAAPSAIPAAATLAAGAVVIIDQTGNDRPVTPPTPPKPVSP